jgi:hypothetical protein
MVWTVHGRQPCQVDEGQLALAPPVLTQEVEHVGLPDDGPQRRVMPFIGRGPDGWVDPLVQRFYSGAKRCMVVLPHVRERLAAALARLRRLYPDAKFPPVTIAVGRGKPVGIGSPVSGVQIGLEALCATDWLNPNVEDRFVKVIAHEYAHVQQVRALVDDEHPTVLEGSLIEGAAEFTAELTSGIAYSYFEASTKGREKEIETASGKPGDLGYWVGYRIVKSNYSQAADKRRALREILAMTDPKAFLAESGWHPGIQLH